MKKNILSIIICLLSCISSFTCLAPELEKLIGRDISAADPHGLFSRRSHKIYNNRESGFSEISGEGLKDMTDPQKLFQMVVEADKVAKAVFSEDYKVNINEDKIVSIKEYRWKKRRGEELLSELKKARDGKAIRNLGKERDVLVLLSRRNGFPSGKKVHLVFVPIEASKKIDLLEGLDENRIRDIVECFVATVKKYGIQKPQFEWNSLIGSEEGVHCSLTSDMRNTQIEELKKQDPKSIVLFDDRKETDLNRKMDSVAGEDVENRDVNIAAPAKPEAESKAKTPTKDAVEANSCENDKVSSFSIGALFSGFWSAFKKIIGFFFPFF